MESIKELRENLKRRSLYGIISDNECYALIRVAIKQFAEFLLREAEIYESKHISAAYCKFICPVNTSVTIPGTGRITMSISDLEITGLLFSEYDPDIHGNLL